MKNSHRLGAALLGAAAVLVTTEALVAQQSFTIIALPDTQNYVTNPDDSLLFTEQTQWIADQILVEGNPRNILFVTHLGDVVSSGSSMTQYDRANASMSVLETGPDGVVPYGILPGNHDYASTGNKSTGTDLYVDVFGPDRFEGRSWFGGAEPSGNNTFQTFTFNGQEFLHIALEWRPTVNVTNGPTRDPSPIEWAQSVILDHPGIPVIVSTHEHIDDDPPGRSPAGEALWNELIRINDQIIMVLNGHYHSAGGMNDGEYHQVSQNDFGQDVAEVLQDYQDYPSGGNGWLRIITFDFAADEIRFETYSPVLDEFQTETVDEVGQFASQFTIEMNFAERFQFADPPKPPVDVFDELCFQQGLDDYAGTDDKEIRSDGNDVDNGDADEISIDGDDGSPGLQPTHAMIRFADVVGDGDGRIAPGTVVDQAILSLNVTNPGSGFDLHEMIVGWDETTTWADFGGDGLTPGIEASEEAVLSLGADDGGENVGVGTLAMDVTATVQAWADGATYEGFGFRSFTSGTNGIDIDSSEGASPPKLIVRTLLPGLAVERFRQGVRGYEGSQDTQIRQADPDTSYADATSVSVDSSDPSDNDNHILIRFDGLFDDGLVPLDREIVQATLSISAFNPGDGATIHRMLVDWVDTVTWNGGFGGDGIQADDVDAVAVPDTSSVGTTGVVEIDVTTSLQAWQADPSSNKGWAFLPTGSNGWDFSTSEATETSRPQLTVVYRTTPPCPADLDGSGEVATPDLLELLGAWGPIDPCPPSFPADLNGDCMVSVDDLLALLAEWGACSR